MPFPKGVSSTITTAVTNRTISQIEVPLSTSYSYEATTSYDITTVKTGPRCQKFYHIGEKAIPYSHRDKLWRLGSLVRKEYYAENQCRTLLKTEIFDWNPLTLSFQPAPKSYLVQYPDSNYFIPVLKKHTVEQNGKTYTTTYTRDKYTNPTQIVMTGELSRTENYTYQNNESRWLIGLPTSKNFTVSGPGVAASNTATETWQYYPNGLLKNETHFGVKTDYVYDNAGNLAKKTDPEGRVTTFSNYYRGIAQTENHPEGVSITRTVDEHGNITSYEDGRGNTTNYQYDKMNRVTNVTTPKGDDSNITINWSYPPSLGLRRSVTRGAYNAVTDFDALGRVKKSTVNGVSYFRNYNNNGELSFASHPGLPNQGDRYQYDGLGRLTKVIHQDNSQILQSYGSGNIKKVTDERGKTTTYTYRAAGDPDTGWLMNIAAPAGQVTDMQRNRLGLLTSVTQGGTTRSFGYDNRFFQTSETHPEVGTVTMTYDAVGNMKSRKVGTNTPIQYTYDGLDRLIKTDYPLSADVTRGYDQNNNLTSLTKGDMQTNGIKWTYGYDANNNLTSETLTHNADQFNFTYGYTGFDALASMTYPDNQVIGYQPDANGRPTKAGNYVSNVQYYPNGAYKRITYGNGVVSDFKQDNRLRPTSITTALQQKIVDLGYSYDDAGNTTGIVDRIESTRNRSMTYDDLNRLKAATGHWGTLNYSYDAKSNITGQTGAKTLNYTYDNKQRLASVGGDLSLSLGYDAYGNVTSNGEHTFQYADDYTLTRVDNSNAVYLYDGNNQRTYTTEGVKYRYSLYAQGGKLLHEQSADGIVDYIYLNNLLIAKQEECGTVDNDSDGMPDCYEIRQGSDPDNSADAQADDDNDQLTNLEEYQAGTSPGNMDTDGDGLPDGWEVQSGLNPLDAADAAADLDSDCVNNLDEYLRGTDPSGPTWMVLMVHSITTVIPLPETCSVPAS